MKAGMGRLAGVMALLALAATGCRTADVRASERPLVDSALSRDLELARFRSATDSTATLTGGAVSPSELAAAWVGAVARSDTAELRRMVLNSAEFAWVFYPTSPQSLPPYDLSPALMWDMLSRQSDAGMTYVLGRLGGKPLSLERLDCGDVPVLEGDNRIWGPCVMTVRGGKGRSIATRLTGPIIERQGRFKFVSYTNDLD